MRINADVKSEIDDYIWLSMEASFLLSKLVLLSKVVLLSTLVLLSKLVLFVESGSVVDIGSVFDIGRGRCRCRCQAPRAFSPTTIKAPVRTYQCTFCTETFKTKHDWQRHEKSLHL